ncbi:MAG TPA: outer membrane protein assembly factor BamD [Chryseolinea sp.]|nr:outer membrane protein assembly factor BamD [Chryseolinea sp.]
MLRVSSFFLIGLVLVLVVSCGKFRKIEKSLDWRVKYEAAMNYYNKKDYYHASVLFEAITPIVRGLPEGEKVQFYLAYCQYYDKLYLLGSEQFKTFYETYGRSPMAEEARYMYAYSLFKSSPKDNLDQSNSVEAMAAMQEFLNRYPNSKFRDQSIDVIVTTQKKLERKGFDNSYQYYKMRQYKAAIVALNNFKDNFPDSEFLEEAYYLVIVSEYRLAEQSIITRQQERYKGVVDHYKEFVDKYPESSFLREAEKIYAASLEKLNKSKNNNS